MSSAMNIDHDNTGLTTAFQIPFDMWGGTAQVGVTAQIETIDGDVEFATAFSRVFTIDAPSGASVDHRLSPPPCPSLPAT